MSSLYAFILYAQVNNFLLFYEHPVDTHNAKNRYFDKAAFLGSSLKHFHLID